MTALQLVLLGIQISMALIVFRIALHATFEDVTYLLRKPGLLVRSLASMYVVMPVVAVLMATFFEFRHAVAISLVASALCPVPPILPDKQMKAGGASSYIVGLLVAASVVSMVSVPIVADSLGQMFHHPMHVTEGPIAKIVATSILLPLLAGVCVRRFRPGLAGRISRPLSVLGTALLVIASLPLIINAWPGIYALIGDFALAAIVAFSLIGLAVGHLLGGPDPDERSVLGLATAARHPAVALAITHDMQDHSAMVAAVLLVLIVGCIVSMPYAIWRRRVHAAGQLRPTAR
jgi:BASS family bile acid:Na+ symporter